MESLELHKIKTINLEQSSKVYFLSLLFCCSCSSLSLSLSLSHLYDFVGYMITKRIVESSNAKLKLSIIYTFEFLLKIMR